MVKHGAYTEVLIKNAIKRESGYLYFVDREGSICRAKMARGGRSPSL
jgi:hypothetical protein